MEEDSDERAVQSVVRPKMPQFFVFSPSLFSFFSLTPSFPAEKKELSVPSQESITIIMNQPAFSAVSAVDSSSSSTSRYPTSLLLNSSNILSLLS
jgi:hypothetical protein